jgi:GxxExxY protein
MIGMEQATKPYDLCGEVIGAAMKVHSALGPAFLESVYQNALIWGLRKCGFKAEAERPIAVQYGIERLEFKKKFRLPKKERVSF